MCTFAHERINKNESMRESLFLYSAHMKMADIIAADPGLLSIFKRLNIRLGFGDATAADICKRYKLSANLFLMICNMYSFSDYVPIADNLKESDTKKIIDYLKTSHNYYVQNDFPRLHKNIHLMMEKCDDVNNRTINKFYDDYQDELDKHFSYEEKIVFPYIEELLSGRRGDYSMDKFKRRHSNVNEKLGDLKNIIIKYLPDKYGSNVRYDVLQDIYRIEKDLLAHTMVEDKLLIPLVSKKERDE